MTKQYAKYRVRLASIRFRRQARRIGHARLVRLGAASLILWSVCLPALDWLQTVSSYQLSSAVQGIVGPTNENLNRKFTYDAGNDTWQFNKDGRAVQAARIAKAQGTDAAGVGQALQQMQAQVGGGGKQDQSLYSVDLPSRAEQGMTVFDNQTSQSFSMVPLFKSGKGKLWQGRLVYPFGNDGQIVYTAKTNGIKEDIVLNKFVSESMQFDYRLNLPSTLEARLQEDGSLGIFSADPALYSDMTYGSDADRAKVESARQTARKDNLVFAVPAPVVVDHTGQRDRAAYSLRDNVLTVAANRLDKLAYPLSIDPSVVITSSSDFQSKGNDEGMIDWSTSGQIGRSMVTGGDTGAWATTSVSGSYSPLRFNVGYASYNGYMYLLGGTGNAVSSSTVQYAQINSDGTVSEWQTTTPMPHSRMYANVVAYNGYLYAYGGGDNGNHGGQIYNTLIYAAINSNGTIGAWQTSGNTMAATVCRSAYAVYNGYLYALGGQTAPGGQCPNSGSTVTSVTQYAPIYANGDVGAWTTTTSLPTARQSTAAAVYNGYIYIHAGAGDFTSSNPNDAYYAPINSDGTIGTWRAIASPFGTYRHNLVAYKGYLYILNGDGATNSLLVTYARINADGSIGSWVTGANAVPGDGRRWGGAAVAYNDRLYIYSGVGDNGSYSNTLYATLQPFGAVTGAATSTAYTTAPGGGYAFAHNGFMYMAGGSVGGTPQTAVRYATINAAGNYGGWSNTSSLNTASYYGGYGISNGKIYIFGGFNSDVVQYATFQNNGTLNAWTATTPLPVTCGNHAGTAYNGYLYYTCGAGGNGASSTIRIAPINSDGSVGAWVGSANTLVQGVAFEAMYAYAGYLYVIGGSSAGSYYNLVQYAKINDNGTIGSWSTTTSTQQAGTYFMVNVINGYMYRVGGEDATTRFATVEYAPVNSNGTLGAWTYTTSLPESVSRSTSTVVGDKFYTIAGNVNGVASTTSYNFTINSGGSGNGTSWVSAGTTLAAAYPNGLNESVTVVNDGYVYAFGGYNPTDDRTNAVRSAPLLEDGTIGTWTQVGTLPETRSRAHAGVYNGRVYIYGGITSGGVSMTYTYAQFGANGTIGSWITQIFMATSSGNITNRVDTAGTIYNGYIYFTGGFLGSTYYDTVYYAPINSDGTVGTFATTSAFGAARFEHSLAFYNGYAYVIGGKLASTNRTSTVQFAQVNSNGTLGAWNYTSSMSHPRSRMLAFGYNGRMYAYQGSNDVFNARRIETASITPNGQLGTWETAGEAGINNTRQFGAGFLYNGRLYTLGGSSGSNYYNDMQMTTLKTVARVGLYSALVNLGSDRALSAVNFTGNSNALVQYRSAGANGVLSGLLTGAAGAGTDPGAGCGAAGTRYVWIKVTLDDSTTMTYGGDSATSNVSEINIYYGLSLRPSPEQRLYGGKSFQQEVMRGHDVCIP